MKIKLPVILINNRKNRNYEINNNGKKKIFYDTEELGNYLKKIYKLKNNEALNIIINANNFGHCKF